ncbi:MAG TPA: (d)CMP kinase [Thermopetrobacter sp.]|nr:(d)CMP kinase [Thermopetrobacter sp.]
MIIAIDGPAAAGKGTLARRIADHYGLRLLDTGALYRAVALAMRAAGHDLADEDAAAALARALDEAWLTHPQLRAAGTGEVASRIAAMPAVRAALLDYQRAFAATPPGAVLDGRDIGTVVCPDADVKLFVTASPEVRARRRWLELRERGEEVPFEEVLLQVRARDERDAGRAEAPLRPATDAHLLDTSELDIEAAFRAARRIIDAHLERGSARQG